MKKLILRYRAWQRRRREAETQRRYDAMVEMERRTYEAGKAICDAMDRADLPRVCSYKPGCNCRACTMFRIAFL